MIPKFCKYLALVGLSVFGKGAGAQIAENFNHNDIAISQGNCWIFEQSGISGTGTINLGPDEPLAYTDLYILIGSSYLRSPFVEFSGNETVTFKHNLLLNFGIHAQLFVYVVDDNGNVVWNNFDHIYRQLCICPLTPNGDPTLVQSETLNINYTGTGRVVWEWYSAAAIFNVGYLDDITISASTTINYEVDTVCEGDQNVMYEPSYVSSSNDYDYDWSFTGAAGGPIQYLSNNDRKVKIDWNNGPGDYQLLSEELYLGSCTGRKTYYNVHVIAKADVSVEQVDTVCEGESTSVELTFSGSGPWTLTYKVNGTANQSLTTSMNPYTMLLPANATTLDLRTVADNGPCSTTKTALPFLNLTYFPDPVTGPIYH